jgi:hypothetical protein
VLGAAALTATRALGQADHRLVVELGPSVQRAVSGGPTSVGGSLAAEVTPVERGPEFELGLSALGGAGEHEFSVDVLAMKSWELSRTLELMVGLGPEVSWHSHTTSLAAEVVGHLMYWPRLNLGLFVEPGFSIEPVRNGERSLGLAAGLIVGVF